MRPRTSIMTPSSIPYLQYFNNMWPKKYYCHSQSDRNSSVKNLKLLSTISMLLYMGQEPVLWYWINICHLLLLPPPSIMITLTLPKDYSDSMNHFKRRTEDFLAAAFIHSFIEVWCISLWSSNSVIFMWTYVNSFVSSRGLGDILFRNLANDWSYLKTFKGTNNRLIMVIKETAILFIQNSKERKKRGISKKYCDKY